MKTLLFCCCILTLPCLAQTASRSLAKKTKAIPPPCVQPVPPTQNLKDDFAKSGLRVLKMIEGETGELSEGPDGSMLVPRDTNQAINNLDVDAQTKDDQAVVRVLQVFFHARLTNNIDISILSSLAKTALLTADLPRGPLQVTDLVSKSPNRCKDQQQ